MKNKRILITGAAGAVGSDLVRQLYKSNKIYGIDINESDLFMLSQETGIPIRVGDIRDKDTIRDIFSDYKPQIVFHAAAYKHVAPMEYVPLEAIKTNILGLYNVLHCSRVYPIEKFIFISTDKAINSTSIMGATKRVGEIMTKNTGKGYVVVRFGNVLGSRGSVIPIWQKQIDNHQPITITDERMERYFMTMEEACQLVIKAAEIGQGGEIIVLEMGKKINILDLAKKIIEGSRQNIPIKIIGRKPGEQLTEKLMSEEEATKAIKSGDFWIIK